MGKKLLSLLSGILILVLGATSTPAATPSPIHPHLFPMEPIVRITCLNGSTGTAEVIAPDTYVTASHVLHRQTQCRVLTTGEIIIPAYDDPKNDLAILRGKTGTRRRLNIDCRGVRKDSLYLAIGYSAEGLIVQPLTGTGRTLNYRANESGEIRENMAVMNGPGTSHAVYSGMSGGPVIGMDGGLVGVVSGSLDLPSNPAAIKEFKRTYLCSGANKPAV